MRATKYTNLETTVEILRCTVCGPITEYCNHDDKHVTTVVLTIHGKGYSDPGKTYGPPENCYPPEGEVYATKTECGDWSCEGLPAGLTETEERRVDDALWEAAACDYEPDYPDYEPDVDEAQEWYDFDPDC